MAYYIEDHLTTSILGPRRPTINEYFLSSYTMAVYDGCEFGCPYCDGWAARTRPFNETVRVAVNIPELLRAELETVDRGDVIGITAGTDAYQPAEASYRLTRQVLQLFAERGQPCVILTKSPAVLEDIVLLQRIHQQSMAMVIFTIVATDINMAEKLEDKAPSPALRLDAISQLKQAGIPTGVAFMPILPYVNDTDYVLSTTIRAVADAGADFFMWDYLRIASDRHRARISNTLARIGTYPPSYYRDLYGTNMLPDAAYRAERDREVLARCDARNLPVRPPHQLYEGRLKPENEAALVLKHNAFRDAVQSRHYAATQGRDLAEVIYRGEANDAQLRTSGLYPSLREIWQRKQDSVQQ